MKVLVIGGGGREHAICWKVAQSKKVDQLFCAPGNAGIAGVAECIDIKAENTDEIVKFAISNNIDLTIVGPEVPLVDGIVDILELNGIKAFGPKKKGALLEGSKAFSKDFMKKYNIPTAKYEKYFQADRAISGLKSFKEPFVVKADGLAAGKGVLICENYEEAETGINNIMNDKKFGNAGDTIIIEEFIDGIEASLLCFVDGKSIIPMESARDYKKAYDNDEGLNTGGMGCFSPNPIYTQKLDEYIQKNILQNIMTGFIEEKMDFKGILFIGLMIKNNRAKVLEFNVRFGDPETQVVLPRMESDLIEIIEKTIDGNLKKEDLKWKKEKSLTVVLASGGYPENYEKGKKITGLDFIDDEIIVFHAGTKFMGDNIVTSGGRVLAVTTLADSFEEARKRIYKNVDKINFEGMEYRTDIGKF